MAFRHPPPQSATGNVGVRKGLFGSKKKAYLTLHAGLLRYYLTSDTAVDPLWTASLIDSQVDANEKKHQIILTTAVSAQTATKNPKKRKVRFVLGGRDDFLKWRDAFTAASLWKLENYYELGDSIGEGQFAKVRRGFEKSSNDLVAVKIIRKSHPNPKISEFIEREYDIMKVISHEHVIKTYDVFDTEDKLYIVLEFMPGGMLFEIIAAERSFSERKASHVMHQILSGLAYLHANQIIHRDIKPDNILCVNRQWPLQCKIADFGLANFMTSEDEMMSSVIGTPFYIAPEIANHGKYGPEVDIWACGVLLYVMLSGRFPFLGYCREEVIEKIKKGHFQFPDVDWKNISTEAKQLIAQMLHMDQRERVTAEQALENPWIKNWSKLGDDNLAHITRNSSLIHKDFAAKIRQDVEDGVHEGSGVVKREKSVSAARAQAMKKAGSFIMLKDLPMSEEINLLGAEGEVGMQSRVTVVDEEDEEIITDVTDVGAIMSE